LLVKIFFKNEESLNHINDFIEISIKI
jgi:hypothetical protein